MKIKTEVVHERLTKVKIDKAYIDETFEKYKASPTEAELLHNISRYSAKKARNKLNFHFIPIIRGQLIDRFASLKAFKQNKVDTKFMDIGCGVGNVLMLARQMYIAETLDGIELDKELIKLSEILLGREHTDNPIFPSRSTIFNEDILSFGDYNLYDILYFFCPIHYYKLQILFEERLCDQAKVGAIIIPILNRHSFIKDERFKAISFSSMKGEREYGTVFEKIKDAPRTTTEINMTQDMLLGEPLPNKYTTMINKHLKMVQKNRKGLK